MASFIDQFAAASTGAVLTTLVVNPLDVVKTTMQSPTSKGKRGCTACGAEFVVTVPVPVATFTTKPSPLFSSPWRTSQRSRVTMPIMRARRRPPGRQLYTSTCCATPVRASELGVVGTMRWMAKVDGLARLYRGLTPSLLAAVPNTTLYFVTYDALKEQLLGMGMGAETGANVGGLAGGGARVLAATATAPFELWRTQLQGGMQVSGLRGIVTRNGGQLSSLWRGLSPTLARDVPFSVLYWTVLETFKARLLESRAVDSPVVASFISGAAAGLVAAAVVTPVDVVKTRWQMGAGAGTGAGVGASGCASAGAGASASAGASAGAAQRPTFMNIGKEIVAKEGWAGLSRGLVPRLTRIPVSCSIMIGSFELVKATLAAGR